MPEKLSKKKTRKTKSKQPKQSKRTKRIKQSKTKIKEIMPRNVNLTPQVIYRDKPVADPRMQDLTDKVKFYEEDNKKLHSELNDIKTTQVIDSNVKFFANAVNDLTNNQLRSDDNIHSLV